MDNTNLTNKIDRFGEMLAKRNTDTHVRGMFNEVADEVEQLIKYLCEIEYTNLSLTLHNKNIIQTLTDCKLLKWSAYKTYKQLKQYRHDKTLRHRGANPLHQGGN